MAHKYIPGETDRSTVEPSRALFVLFHHKFNAPMGGADSRGEIQQLADRPNPIELVYELEQNKVEARMAAKPRKRS